MPVTQSSSDMPAHTAAHLASAQDDAAFTRPSGQSAAEDPQFTLGVTPQGSREAYECASAWQRHVDAGNIGKGSGQTVQQLMRHFRNEEVLLGHRPEARRSVRLK